MTKVEKIVIVAIVLILGISAYAAIKEHQEWQFFSAQHHCVVVEKINSQTITSYGMRADGQYSSITTTVPGRTSYKCDDDVIYQR